MITPMLIEVVLRLAVPADGVEDAVRQVRAVVQKWQETAEPVYDRGDGGPSHHTLRFSGRPSVMRVVAVAGMVEWLSMPNATVVNLSTGCDLTKVLADLEL